MSRDDFQMGTEFYTAAGKWRCTDIGIRAALCCGRMGFRRIRLGRLPCENDTYQRGSDE